MVGPISSHSSSRKRSVPEINPLTKSLDSRCTGEPEPTLLGAFICTVFEILPCFLTAGSQGLSHLEYVYVCESSVSDSLRPHGLWPTISSVHGILQARTLDWLPIPFSRGSSQPRELTSTASPLAGGFFTKILEYTSIFTDQHKRPDLAPRLSHKGPK